MRRAHWAQPLGPLPRSLWAHLWKLSFLHSPISIHTVPVRSLSPSPSLSSATRFRITVASARRPRIESSGNSRAHAPSIHADFPRISRESVLRRSPVEPIEPEKRTRRIVSPDRAESVFLIPLVAVPDVFSELISLNRH